MKDYVKQSRDVLHKRRFAFKNLVEYKAKLIKAQDYLSKQDRILKVIIFKIGDCRLKPHKKYFETLVDAIVSQQLSIRVAESIFQRFKLLFSKSSTNGEKFPTPEEILLMPDEKVRACGLSNPKVKYVKDLALKVKEGTLKIKKLKSLPDEEIINELIQVKGIGVWTAHMFLIFCLGRLNVLPVGDLGLKRAIMINYNLKNLPDEGKIDKLSKKFCWYPYNSVAAWYLWQSMSVI